MAANASKHLPAMPSAPLPLAACIPKAKEYADRLIVHTEQGPGLPHAAVTNLVQIMDRAVGEQDGAVAICLEVNAYVELLCGRVQVLDACRRERHAALEHVPAAGCICSKWAVGEARPCAQSGRKRALRSILSRLPHVSGRSAVGIRSLYNADLHDASNPDLRGNRRRLDML